MFDRERLFIAAIIVWQIGSWVTFVQLTFLDDYVYTWWNWIIVLPINLLLSALWPIFWLILRPIFGS